MGASGTQPVQVGADGGSPGLQEVYVPTLHRRPRVGAAPRPGWGASVAEEEARACPPGEQTLLLALGVIVWKRDLVSWHFSASPIRADLESSVPQGGWS